MLHVQLARGVNAVPTTSMGRLFDAVSSLLGVRHDITFEAQAAIELELLASAHAEAGLAPVPLSLPLTPPAATGRARPLDCGALIRAVVAARGGGHTAGAIALGFHHAVADAALVCAAALHAETGIRDVCLTGGVFANALLLALTTARLRDAGLTPRTHRLVPPNDGGISLGQAAIAAATAQDRGAAR